MAKYYIDLAHLLEWADDVTGYYKPGGTLGPHHCIVSPQADGSAYVTGSYSGKVHLLPGDKLGYDCGSVWRLKAPVTPLEKLREKLYMKVEWNYSNMKSVWGEHYYSVVGNDRDQYAKISHSNKLLAVMVDGSESKLTEVSQELDKYKGSLGDTVYESERKLAVPDGAVAVLNISTKLKDFRFLDTYTLWVEKNNNKTMTALNKWAAQKLEEAK